MEGHLLVVSAYARRLLRLEGERLVEVADLSGLVTYPLNDMVINTQGRIYIGNLGYDFGDEQSIPQLAPIVLVMPDGSARITADGLAFPNGMAITPDGQTLLVAESHGACLTAFTIDNDGSLSNRRLWAKFDAIESVGSSDNQVTPDGICLDAEGALWVASPNTKEVLRVREGAQITHRIRLDTIPLACMLGGMGRRTLFIPTTDSLDPNDTQAKGRIEIVDVDVPGAGLP